MNQDFALAATPAIARRLLAVRDACQIDLPPEIIALAEQDRLDPAIFDPLVCPYNETRYRAAQFLLDGDLRGVIQTSYHPEISPLTVLTVAKRASQGITVILPYSEPISARAWRAASIACNIATKTQQLHWVKDHLNEIDRHTTLIVVIGQGVPDRRIETYYLRVLAREFPHLIIYDNNNDDDVVPWPVWGRVMCPSMPHPLLTKLLKDGRSHWQQPLITFAILYTVAIFPDLLTSSARELARNDGVLLNRLQSYLGILKD